MFNSCNNPHLKRSKIHHHKNYKNWYNILKGLVQVYYIEIAFILIVYISIIFAAYILKKRTTQNIAWWEIVLFLIVGIISFSIELEFFGTMYKFALLPLGAVLFYLFTRNKESAREKYKPFVWLGFVANYVFFITGILTIPVTNAIFPPNELSTYIKSLEQAQILTTHISAVQTLSLKDNATELLQEATLTTIEADQWYGEQLIDQKLYSVEKFPYLLTDVTAPAGMKEEVFYFVEQEGKGLLIQTPASHYYFRTTVPIVQNVGEE